MIRTLIGEELARQFTKHVTKRAYDAYSRRVDRLKAMAQPRFRRSSGRPGLTLTRGRWSAYKKRRMRPRRLKRRNYKRRARGVSAKYVQRVANRGKERLHISYNSEVPVDVIISDNESPAGYDKSFVSKFTMINNCFNLLKNPTAVQAGDNRDDTDVQLKWGHLQVPGFTGDYVFYQKTRGVVEIGLRTGARESTGDGVPHSSLDDNAPWLVRVICVTPRTSSASFENIGFRSLSGEKIGYDIYSDYTTAAAAEPSRWDCQQLIKNGLINKQDFYVHMDTRFELGAGNVAATVSKKIPFNFKLNKDVKYEGFVNTEPVTVNPGTLETGSHAKRKFDKQWFVFCTPSVYNDSESASTVLTAPINVTVHGVTLALD